MSELFWAVLAALIWGIVPLIEKSGLVKVEPLTGLFFRSLGVFIATPFLFFFMSKPLGVRNTDLRSAGLLMLGGFLASFLAQLCFYNGLKIGEVSKVVPIAGAYPLISFILGIIILGEPVNLMKTGGVLLIVLGIWAIKLG